jgi:hypothetical protein
MEMSQGNQCIVISNKQNVIVFTRSQSRRAEQVLSGGLVPVGRERMWGKDVGG